MKWPPNYDSSWLKSDIIASLSERALMVPTSLGYATISGVPAQHGFYAAAIGLIAFALFTTSKQVSQGPSSSTAAVLGAAVLAVASAGSDEAVTIAASIVLVAGGLFIIGDDHIHEGISAAVRIHLTQYPSDRKVFHDLLELMDQAKSLRSINA